MTLVRAELLRPFQLGRNVLIHDISQVLYLPFDHDDGSYARDRSGHANHGTIYGASKIGGKIGGALSFDGTNDYVKVAHSSSLDITGDKISLAFWFNANSVDGFGVFVNKRTSANVGGWMCQLTTNQLVMYVMIGGSWKGPASSAILSTGLWYHAVCVYDGLWISIYLNGSLSGTSIATIGNIDSVIEDVRIGSRDGTQEFFDGIIDELRIYNRALSQAEIVRVMNLRGV